MVFIGGIASAATNQLTPRVFTARDPCGPNPPCCVRQAAKSSRARLCLGCGGPSLKASTNLPVTRKWQNVVDSIKKLSCHYCTPIRRLLCRIWCTAQDVTGGCCPPGTFCCLLLRPPVNARCYASDLDTYGYKSQLQKRPEKRRRPGVSHITASVLLIFEPSGRLVVHARAPRVVGDAVRLHSLLRTWCWQTVRQLFGVRGVCVHVVTHAGLPFYLNKVDGDTSMCIYCCVK